MQQKEDSFLMSCNTIVEALIECGLDEKLNPNEVQANTQMLSASGVLDDLIGAVDSHPDGRREALAQMCARAFVAGKIWQSQQQQ